MSVRLPRHQAPLRRLPSAWWVLVLMILIEGCGAYYNTFYHAKKRYQEAEVLQRAQGERNPTPQILGMYQEAIDKSQKVIEDFPDSKWVDDARYLMGRAQLGRQEYEAALATFQRLIASHPESKLIPEARLGIGMCHVGTGDYVRADQVLEDLLQSNRKFDRRDEVYLELAKSAALRRDHQAAAERFTRLLERSPERRVSIDALRHRGDAYRALGDHQAALADFLAVEEAISEPELRYEVGLDIGQALEELGRFDEALARYQALEREMATARHLPRTLLSTARVTNRLGDHARAVELYESIVEKYPGGADAAQAQFQLGNTYEVYLHDNAKAIEAYSQVRAVNASSDFVDLAESRQADLERLGALAEEVTSGSGDAQAEAAYQLAEVKLFRLNKPAEAIEDFASLESDFPLSRFAPKAAYAIGYTHESELGDSVAAHAAYQRVYERYPQTEYGLRAGVWVGALDRDSLNIWLGAIEMERTRRDSLARARAFADSLTRADSLWAAGGDTTATEAAPADSLRAAGADTVVAAADSLAAHALERSPMDPEERSRRLVAHERMRDSLMAIARARRESLDTRQRRLIDER